MMPANEEWASKNLDLDVSSPRTLAANPGDPASQSDRDLRRALIDFDSEGSTRKDFGAEVLWPVGVPCAAPSSVGPSLPSLPSWRSLSRGTRATHDPD
jgi:hypothetical protein